MADDFNPYHVWLGIPPKDQPANHYRLLSLTVFETSGDVIDSAADRQMAHLRTFQSGKHGELTQRLLNEVAAARVCLLDPKKRAAYDQQLRAKLAATTAPTPATGATPQTAGGSAIQRQPPRRPTDAAPATSVPMAAALPQPADQWDDLLGKPDVKSPNGVGRRSAKSAAAKRGATNRNISIGIAAGVVLIAAAAFGINSLNGPSEGTLVFDWPDRADVAVTVDNAPIDVPASGSWEHSFSAGTHHVAAQRPAFKFATDVDLAAGQRLSVPPDWNAKAVLVLSWPAALRSGAVLKIDGRVQSISQHDPLEVPVEPGRHLIQITRPGSETISVTASVEANGRELVAIKPPPTTATLVFDWPADERTNAELTVDGHSQTVSARAGANPFELTVPPGKHVVRIARTGFESFSQSVELSAGANEPIKPTWTLDPKATQAVADTAPAETAPQPVKKLAPPSAAEIERVSKEVDSLYKTTGTGLKDPAKAQELYDVAAKDGSSPAERYVLLMKGAEIAAGAGDLNLSLQGIDNLDAAYEIDALEWKQKLLEKFIGAAKPDKVADAIPVAEQLVDQAVAADKYEAALVLATAASHAASKSQVPTHASIQDRLSRRRHDIRIIEPIYAKAKESQATLDKNPADPEANLAVGRWLCFYKGDWTTGLPLLAKSSDEKLKSLAAAELKSPSDAEQQVALADAWWAIADKEARTARDCVHLHAGGIYQAALPNLASALRKAAIEKRLAEIANLQAAAVSAAVAAGAKPASGTKFPLHKWVDVLRHVDATKDVVQGSWLRRGSEIAAEFGGRARLTIPVVVDGGYDLEVDFTRISGSDDVTAMIPVGPRGCAVLLSGQGGKESGLTDVDGHSAWDGPNPTVIMPGQIENGHRYRLSVAVRLLSDDRASVDVALDAKPYLPHWEGRIGSLSENSDWTMRNLSQLGLGTLRAGVIFHSVRLRMISGHATADIAVADSAPPAAPPIALAPGGAPKFPLGQWVDVLRLVDTRRNIRVGKWARSGDEVSIVEPTGGGRIVIPVAVEGSYDLETEFVRDDGSEDIGTTVPVGSHACQIMLGTGRVRGLDTVNEKRSGDDDNPSKAISDEFQNGHVYRLLAKVRLLDTDKATVDVLIDGKPSIHWDGDPAALSFDGAWAMPTTDHLGFGAWGARATLKSARLRMVSGRAAADNPENELAASPIAPHNNSSNGASAATKFPLNKWVDILGLIDPARDRVNGRWSRDGVEVLCDRNWYSRIEVPVAIDGAYDLEVEFTRTEGENDANTIIPVGPEACDVVMSGWGGKASGLALIDGHSPEHDDNPTSTRPGTLDNGHRYKVLINVRLPQPGRASIDVSLDGKPYFPHWEGSTSSLNLNGEWSIPHSSRPGLATFDNRVTYHTMRLRMISGRAAVDIDGTGLPPATGLPTIVSANWGRDDFCTDVTTRVRRTVARGEIVRANPDFFQSDPFPGSGKRLDIIYKVAGEEKTVNIDEGGKWSREDYASP